MKAGSISLYLILLKEWIDNFHRVGEQHKYSDLLKHLPSNERFRRRHFPQVLLHDTCRPSSCCSSRWWEQQWALVHPSRFSASARTPGHRMELTTCDDHWLSCSTRLRFCRGYDDLLCTLECRWGPLALTRESPSRLDKEPLPDWAPASLVIWHSEDFGGKTRRLSTNWWHLSPCL